jgi:Fic/DOC family protein
VASWLNQSWDLSLDAPTRATRQGGCYQAYLPDLLVGRPLALGAEISARASDVEAAVRRLTLSPESQSLEGLARFLLRSEAIASSRIEGMQASAQQVALAELAQTEEPVARGFSHNAQLVANNRLLAVSSGFGDQVSVIPAWRVDEGVMVSLAA